MTLCTTLIPWIPRLNCTSVLWKQYGTWTICSPTELLFANTASLTLPPLIILNRYLKSGPGNLEKDMERRFSYALSREDIENAILGGPWGSGWGSFYPSMIIHKTLGREQFMMLLTSVSKKEMMLLTVNKKLTGDVCSRVCRENDQCAQLPGHNWDRYKRIYFKIYVQFIIINFSSFGNELLVTSIVEVA